MKTLTALVVSAASTALFGFARPVQAQQNTTAVNAITRATNTDSFPLVRPDAQFANVRLAGVIGGAGHIGIDIGMAG